MRCVGRADAIVVGAGLAGLVSTLELLRSGHACAARPLRIPAELGGLAREAFGGMFMVDSPEQRRSRIHDSERLALEDWLRIAEFDPEDVWPRRWAEQYVTRARDDVGGWLREHRRALLPGRQLGRARQLRRRQLGAPLSPHLGDRQGAGARRVGARSRRHPRRAALDLRFQTRASTELVMDGRTRVGLPRGVRAEAGEL